MYKNLTYALIITVFITGSYLIARPFLADFYYRKGLKNEDTHWIEATTAYQKAITLDPSNAEYYSKLGRFYLRRARLQPQSKTYFLNLATTFIETNEPTYVVFPNTLVRLK